MGKRIVRLILVLAVFNLSIALAQEPPPVTCTCSYCETHALGWCSSGPQLMRCTTYYAMYC